MQKYLGGYFVCAEHHQPMNLACLNDKCSNKGILCSYCEYKNHKHTVKALSSIFNEVDKDMKTYNECLNLMAQIDETFTKIELQINKIENVDDKKIVKEMVENYHNYSIQKFFKRNKLVLELTNQKQLSIKYINEFINKYNFITNQQKEFSCSNCQYDVRIYLQNLKNICKDVKQFIRNNQPIQKLFFVFSIEDQKKIKYYFNAEKSHKDFVITNKIKAELKEGFLYRVALLDPVIKKEGPNSKKSSCIFKVLKVSAMVGVGAVYKSKSQTANYVFSAYSQHGCYFITNSGYIYNQSNTEFNSQIKNWTFAINDYIKVTVFPRQKKITFEKQGQNIFEMPFEDRLNMQLNFGILQCQKDDCVEIIPQSSMFRSIHT